MEVRGLGKVAVMAAQRKYPHELKYRAVRLVFELRSENQSKRGANAQVGAFLNRSLAATKHPSGLLDATYCKARVHPLAHSHL